MKKLINSDYAPFLVYEIFDPYGASMGFQVFIGNEPLGTVVSLAKAIEDAIGAQLVDTLENNPPSRYMQPTKAHASSSDFKPQ